MSSGVTNRRLAQSVPSRTSRSPRVRPMACVGTKTHFESGRECPAEGLQLVDEGIHWESMGLQRGAR